MMVNKFIGHRQSGKTTFLINLARAFSTKKVLFVTPSMRHADMIKKFFEEEYRVVVKSKSELVGEAYTREIFDLLLIDEIGWIGEQDYNTILSRFKRDDTLVYVTCDSENHDVFKKKPKSDELKTLKEIEEGLMSYHSIQRELIFMSNPTERFIKKFHMKDFVLKEDLRAEAIKWVKKIREGISNTTPEIKFEDGKLDTSGVGTLIISKESDMVAQWIIYFFNLSEEEVSK